jgi:membrane protein YdbS with pleckstrin-like domain
MSEEPSPAAPPRPRRTSPDSAQSNAATAIALFGLLLVGGALLGLTVLVLPQIVGLVAVVGGLFVIPIAFHYLVWGWWMSQMKDDDPDDE